ncbi:hypothetical protein Patl1_07030 [Pistacia atlantica]|uniref:Uncharacterized protein n=1 Tax=Pistacia atlantica TaxID=434234 RepID=A0ACC1AEY3_9ROSI|nr:hypothetical protein Patl1_07030 [Pistacia atlantica]
MQSSFDIAEDDEGTTSPTLKDDDIRQMDKIQMEVGGKETAKIVLGFQQEGYPHRGLTTQVCPKSGGWLQRAS